MIWTLLTTLATAGTIYVDSINPVLCKVDNELVRKDPATRIIVPDLAEGAYHVEITNLFGSTIAFKDVDMSWQGDVHLKFDGDYLDEVVPENEAEAIDQDGLSPLGDLAFRDMMRKLVKGSAKKKLKVLDACSKGGSMTIRQIDEMLASLHTRQDRRAALVLISDRMSQPNMCAFLDHHFGVKSDREAMHELCDAIVAKQQ
jgi:hypothetical protein